MPRWIVIKDDYGEAISNLAVKKKWTMGVLVEDLLDSIPEVKKELQKIRSKKHE